MHHGPRDLRTLTRLLRKLLVNGLSTTVKRLLLQWSLAAVNWLKKLALKNLKGHRKGDHPPVTPPEIRHDNNTVICYSQEPVQRNIQVWADSVAPTYPEQEKVDIPSSSQPDVLVASPEIESPPFKQTAFGAFDFSVSVKDRLNEERLWPMFPEYVYNGRYDQKAQRKRSETEQFTIPAMTIEFRREEPLPFGWKPMQHPEGALYFYHEELQAFTDVDLYDQGKAEQICISLQTMDDVCKARSFDRTDIHIVLTILDCYGPDDIGTGYYLVKHSSQCVFYFHAVEVTDCAAAEDIMVGINSPTHIAHEVNAQYWTHCMQYPNSLKLTLEIANQFMDMATYYMGDAMLSRTSTVPYSLDELQRMITLASQIRKNSRAGGTFYGSTSVLSGFMMCATRHRFYNYHGQYNARLERDRSIHGDTSCRRSWVIKTLSPLFFFAPDVHLRGLAKLWIDGRISHVWWNQFMGKLYNEWQEFVLYGTVLLNANVAFLAIQSVDEATEGPSRSAAQVTSYSSVIASVGCIIIGLVLIRSNRSKAKDSAFEAATYLQRVSKRTHGLEMFSVMVSLPYAMLMWATISFLAAFVLMVFKHSDINTRVLLATAGFVLACLISWCVYMQWEKREEDFAAAIEVPPTPSPPENPPIGQLGKLAVPIRRMSTSLRWPMFLQRPRRSTVDSDRTAV